MKDSKKCRLGSLFLIVSAAILILSCHPYPMNLCGVAIVATLSHLSGMLRAAAIAIKHYEE